MMNNYQWSRRSIPRRMNTIFEVSRLLGLGRHQTLRRLKASGLPYRTYIRRWQDATGKWYSRKATGIPQQTAAELIKNDMVDSLAKGWKSFSRAIKSQHTETPPQIRDLMNSIRHIRTDQPPPFLFRPRPLRLKTVPKSFKVRLPRIKKG